jgi:hypothetical protein
MPGYFPRAQLANRADNSTLAKQSTVIGWPEELAEDTRREAAVRHYPVVDDHAASYHPN